MVAYVSCSASHQVAAIQINDWSVRLIEAGRGADKSCLGEVISAVRQRSQSRRRNDPCMCGCGSGNKCKRCYGGETMGPLVYRAEKGREIEPVAQAAF
jgi:hypothetical protein